ncbi:MAG: hypothetical protein ACD_80C00056G0006 [uncultured bacterium (gcode 4)]|uniref:Uncharacterized protein n=1 Tax=uncultured bacterium (gcode 4) TaxID=1234023 RepID=K1YJ66_9BACT|nr:MAG: hypothetical protein ACD_80C00056G0006 [uncultured bacterium (gcode 4)]HBB03941.1 hypothetical protein [Candidatus Gracilibacteria bacterium]
MKESRGKASNKKCILCGKKTKLVKTECCNQWICDDEDKYQLFSYSTVSCSRNHRRYTLCGFHLTEGHAGKWQTCDKCKNEIDVEMYAWYGTNEHNFEKLTNPPKFNPTHCVQCDRIIKRGVEGYTHMPHGTFLCEECGQKHMDELMSRGK